MIKTFSFLAVILSAYLLSCKNQIDYSKNYNNSSHLAFSIIKDCVDAMKNSKPSMNTKNYVLDLSSVDTLNKSGIDSFLRIKNMTLPTTSDDSLMITGKEDVITDKGGVFGFHMKQSMIIRISTLTHKSDKIVIVTASKIKSSSEIVDAIIELERQTDGYKINNLKIIY